MIDEKEKQRREMIALMKEELKAYAAIQVKLKLCRKTKRGDQALKAKFIEELGIKEKPYYKPEEQAVMAHKRNRITITVLLNLYHEIRGSEHRHVMKEPGFYVKQDLAAAEVELRKKFKLDARLKA